MRYLNELWRLCRVNGCVLIISTLHSTLFRDLLEHSRTWGYSAGGKSSGVLKQQRSLRTNEGGDVFYYLLKKTSNVEPSGEKKR